MSKMVKSRGKRPIEPADDFPEFSNGEEFDALSAEDKERVAKFYEQGRHRKEMRPLNAGERAQVTREKKMMGRPKIGKGVKVISLSVEQDLLKRADAYAKAQGLKRAEFFTQAILKLLPKAG